MLGDKEDQKKEKKKGKMMGNILDGIKLKQNSLLRMKADPVVLYKVTI